MTEKIFDSCSIPASLAAPAKVNLGLRIVGRRDDGYHRLESLFWPLTFADALRLTAATASSVETGWAEDAPRQQPLPPPEENLVTKALAVAAPLGTAWKARLTKRIPMGAGLGGGSSDAGAVLRHFGASEETAARLGADVPFFLDPRPTWVSGIGEARRPLILAPDLAGQLHFLLVLLPEPVDTRAAFRVLREQGRAFSPSTPPPEEPLDRAHLEKYFASARNDLLPAASTLCPRISTIIAALRSQPCLYADLSGSGSTCFAIFDAAAAREKTSQVLDALFRDNYCRVVFAETFGTR